MGDLRFRQTLNPSTTLNSKPETLHNIDPSSKLQGRQHRSLCAALLLRGAGGGKGLGFISPDTLNLKGLGFESPKP